MPRWQMEMLRGGRELVPANSSCAGPRLYKFQNRDEDFDVKMSTLNTWVVASKERISELKRMYPHKAKARRRNIGD